MVLEQDLWLRIEKDEESNLALSPEEAELLESIRRPDGPDAVGLPLFINGRAGSGKSTMLQYLAADYLEFALRKSTRARPIYMTSSGDLLERARQTVRGLLTVHHERLLDGSLDEASIDAALAGSFVVFHEYLYSLLEPADHARFPAAKRVTYAAFRRLWSTDFARRPEARRITVDLAWHTIRSYIKGIRSTEEDELDPDEFRALPRKRRSVSPEMYDQIFKVVWEGWYKRLCEEEGLWDDQDLAARVLAGGKARTAGFAAVLCDEAQDFTPLELEIIFQLSLYSQRSLRPEQLRRVPIAFAGDPLQTINPTGFRWDAVQADFHAKYGAVLDPNRSQDVAISYRELRFNYRSNPGIVHFCNLIQLIRSAVLDRPDVAPQDAWWVDEPTQTVWFAADDGVTAQQLQARPELIKVVNCEEGEESSFAENDAILKALGAEADNIFRNVLGPTRAKGLEFPAVVLYRFSERAPANFARVIAEEVALGDDPEIQLPYEYFFNRLYVAASRARAQLVVVDSGDAFRDFWRFATDAELVDRWMRRLKDPSIWRDSINYLVRGRAESWTGERIDPLEQATEFAEQGRRTRDPYLLRQASLAFRDAKRPIEAGRCLAEALQFEGKLTEAGERYQDLGLLEDAYRCYWEASAFDSLGRLATDAQFGSRLESRAADFMVHPRELNATFLDAVTRAAESSAWRREALRSATWTVVLRTVLEVLARGKPSEDPAARKALDALKQLQQEGLDLSLAQLAALAYAVGEYSDAVAFWESAGATDREEYRRAKAYTAAFPENLAWLGRLKAHGDVVAQWREHIGASKKPISLDDASTRYVIDAALEEGDVELACDMIERRPDEARIGRLLKEATKLGNADVARRGVLLAIRQMVSDHDWPAVVKVAESGDLGKYARGNPALRPLLEASGDGRSAIVIVLDQLARSDDLAADASSGQGPVTDFLHRTFVRKGYAAATEYGVPIEVSGAAIERAGRILDAIQYYEAILADQRASERERAFAAERLVRSLERHAEYLRARGDEPQARRQESRARQVRDRTGLKGRRVPDFPKLGGPGATPPSTEVVRGPFRIVSSAAHQRVRIEHMDRFETVTVDGNERSLRGDVAFEAAEAVVRDGSAWTVPAWDATISLRASARRLVVEIRWAGHAAEVSLPTR
jgi:superfamily I DNA/RNA helicase